MAWSKTMTRCSRPASADADAATAPQWPIDTALCPSDYFERRRPRMATGADAPGFKAGALALDRPPSSSCRRHGSQPMPIQGNALRRPLVAFAVRVALSALVLGAASIGAEAGRIVTDSAGRQVEVPDRIERVMAAGPPASVLVYVLAPQKLVGWNRKPREAELPYLAPAVRDLPEIGRLTGRGDTANVEVVLKAKPDVIIDFGSVTATYVSLADRVQAQTKIPYLLVDGRFGNTAAALRLLGGVLGVEARAQELAKNVEEILADVDRVVAAVPEAQRPRVYFARGPNGDERMFEFVDGSGFDSAAFNGWARGDWGAEPWNGGWWGTGPKFLILSAQYGSEFRHVDVTGRLKELARENRQLRIDYRTFRVDPDVGHAKALRVFARGPNGRERMFEFRDGDIIDGRQFRGWGTGEWAGENDRWSGRWEGEEREEIIRERQ